MWRINDVEWVSWILEISLYGTYIVSIALLLFWPMSYGLIYRNLLVVLFLICAIKSFKTKKRKWANSINLKKSILYVLTLIAIGILMTANVFALKGRECPPDAVELSFPLKDGEFCIVHGGSDVIVNHHYNVSAQRYALDIIQLNNVGLNRNKAVPKILDDFNIYRTKVYSPCNGIVIEAVNQYPDLQLGLTDSEHLAGNYVLVAKEETNVLVLLAHLKKDSIKVKAGDFVKTGQQLGEVGNSGNTSEPHLHIHALVNQSGDILFSGQGIPMKFNGRFLIRNDVFSH